MLDWMIDFFMALAHLGTKKCPDCGADLQRIKGASPRKVYYCLKCRMWEKTKAGWQHLSATESDE